MVSSRALLIAPVLVAIAFLPLSGLSGADDAVATTFADRPLEEPIVAPPAPEPTPIDPGPIAGGAIEPILSPPGVTPSPIAGLLPSGTPEMAPPSVSPGPLPPLTPSPAMIGDPSGQVSDGSTAVGSAFPIWVGGEVIPEPLPPVTPGPLDLPVMPVKTAA